MAKFDLDKERKAAEASIAASEKRIEKIREGLPKAEESLKRAQGRVGKIEDQVADERANIEKLQQYLVATADLGAPAPEPVEQDAPIVQSVP